MGDDHLGDSISGQGYYGIWLGIEQVPLRAVTAGLIGPFDSLDPSTGGETARYSLYTNFHRQDQNSDTHLTAYLVHYNLDLYSDFTYFLNQTTGDEIDQRDSRSFTGFRADHTNYDKILEMDTGHTFGLQVRQDFIGNSLNHVQLRNYLYKAFSTLLLGCKTKSSGSVGLDPLKEFAGICTISPM